MPQYSWRCNKCEKTEDVVRSMADYEKGPDNPCECGSVDRTRVIQQWLPHQTQLVLGKGGWHCEEYTRLGKPIR